MKKVGLCTTFENANNYGTMLQAFATKKCIENLGYECRMIRYKRKYDIIFIFAQGLRIFEHGFFSHELKRYRKKKQLKKCVNFSSIYVPRTYSVKKFQEEVFLNYVDTYYGYRELCKGSSNYNAVVVGSDQLWLPSGMRTNFFNLMFVDDHIKKISYATSFGVAHISRTYWKDMRKYIPRINYLSVREKSGQKLIKEIVGLDAKVVVDPTMLLTKEEWEKMIPDKKEISEDYIFCYFLGRNKACRDFAYQIKKKTGYRIVVLKHLDEYIEADDDFGDIAPADIGPREFVNYIRYAKYVLTDSFHGTVFSILHHKQFMTFYRFRDSEKMSKNSRIDTLLQAMGLEKRLYEKDKENAVKELIEKIDYTDVDEKLSILRDKSKQFLADALNA